MHEAARAQTVLGFDFGEKRIGVAVGNTVTRTASALTTLHVASNAERLAAIEKLVQEWQPARFVVGQPRHRDGAPHEIARLAAKFGNRLRENFRIAVEYVDETTSSAEAAAQLAALGARGAKRDAVLDAAAARIILQRYLDALPGVHAHAA
jgi:putative Holliday junction resolvase